MDLAKIIVKAILLLEDAGVQVMGITGDGASTNRTMWNILGVSGKVDKFKNTFSNPFNNSRQVYVFSDPPHLLKTVRNRLYTKRTLRVC